MTDIKTRIEEANEKVLEALLSGDPHWVGMKRAGDTVPGMKENYILHSGPPIDWDRRSEVQKKGILSGILFERLANTEEEALALVEKGEIELYSAHDFDVVAPAVGIVTPSMTVNICRDFKSGHEGYCIPFEGRDGLGVWGVYNEKVDENLRVINNVLAPAVNSALEECGGINIKNIIAKGLEMNDETHSRQVAQGLVLVSEIVPLLVKSSLDRQTLIQCVNILVSTERWFHPLGMASSMTLTKAASNIEYSTIVTALVSNGVETGIKVSALGNEWITAPAPALTGKYFSTKYTDEDAMPNLGDSSITEVVGLGGFSAAAAPHVVRLRGGTVKDAIKQSEEMKLISAGINHNYPIPNLEFTGPPIGMDIRKVISTGICPAIHGGIVSKKGGQIGAGVTRLPMELFEKALESFVKKYDLA